MGLELSPVDGQCDVAEFLHFEKLAEIVRKAAIRNFELNCIRLSRNIDAIRNDANLEAKMENNVSDWDEVI